ncbi:hypothetical protein NPIL_235661 [Nephila pilipes]|uniref:Uncharacterized protein n=1 Tax=Nephila pilipes TaxID=299642 RepID=A0A8X6JG33_NEPPI|nr:hypothetical protein NPIL_235661 [Nephila pilipes]
MALFCKLALYFSWLGEKHEVTSDLTEENLPRLQKGLRSSPLLIKILFYGHERTRKADSICNFVDGYLGRNEAFFAVPLFGKGKTFPVPYFIINRGGS